MNGIRISLVVARGGFPQLSKDFIGFIHAIRDSASPRPKMYWILKEICKKETGF